MRTVTALDLTKEKRVEQTSLFESEKPVEDSKKENLQKALDKLKSKYGNSAVQSASVMKTDLFK